MTSAVRTIADAPPTSWRSVFRALLITGKRVNRQADVLLQPQGLLLAELRLLGLLEDRSPRSLGEISRLLYYGKSSITRLVDRLEADGLVGRVRDGDDRRSVSAVITDAGITRLKVGRDAMESANWGLGGLSEQQRRLLLELLEQATT